MAKICFLADADSIHTRKWVDYFSKFDNDIYLISMRDTKYRYKENVKVIVVEPPFKNKMSYFFIVRHIKNIIEKIKPDILHSHYASSYGLYGRMSGHHPFIVSVWGSDVYEFPTLSKVNSKLLKFILNGTDAVCSTSVDMARELKTYYNKNVIITPFGVDIHKFNVTTPILSKEYITIGIVKNLEKIYGIKYLIEAFHDFCKKNNNIDVRLLIVGNGREREYLENLTKLLKIDKKVTFVGAVDNNKVPEYLNRMDIVCIPSIMESFGVSAVEACACGRPIIATNVGGLKEIVVEGYNGYTINPCSSSEIVDKMELLLSDKVKLTKFSKNAREFVQKNYDWHENVKIMDKLYKRFINKKM